MAFFLSTTSVYPGVIPTPVEATTSGAILFNDGTNAFWAYPGSAQSTTPANLGAGWRYRTILTHGYIAAGYKGYSPWRSLNKTWHQTDTTVYCGEQISKAGAYLDGTWSDYNAYVHGTSDTWQGAASYTSGYSLFNGVMRTVNNTNFVAFSANTAPYGYMGHNPATEGINYGDQANPAGTGGLSMSVTRVAHGCASTQGNGSATPGGSGYVFGGSPSAANRVDKLHFVSEVMYIGPSSPVNWGTVAAVGGETKAWINGNSSTSYNYYMTWSNDTYTAWGFNSGTTDGNNKHLMSKYGHFYAGVGGNTDTRRWKFNDSTGAYILEKTKLGSFGEENQEMGQDWGYMMGNYNGQQNNWTTKTAYSTDTETTLGFGAQPKGHYGTSSGCCSSASAMILTAQRA